MAGRKTLTEELQITRRYAQLSDKAFKLITKKLESSEKSEQNFALDWLKGGFAKMIPQKIGGDPDNRTPIPISNIFVNAVQNNHSNAKDSQAK